MEVKVLILTGDGVNCERETALAFSRFGALTEILHINELSNGDFNLDHYHILALPGGFSFGDELGSGKVFSLKLKKFLSKQINDFILVGKPVLGICNGFQVLCKLGIFNSESCLVGLAHNDHGRFIDRWVDIKVKNNKSIWLKGIDKLKLPVRHGEGRFVFNNKLSDSNAIPSLFYGENINGSEQDIAGVCDKTGVVLGLMPHPEAAVDKDLYPGGIGLGILGDKIFKNSVDYIKENFNDEN